MPPEVRDLLDALREELTPSEYVQRSVEADARRRSLESPQLPLARVARAHDELPGVLVPGGFPRPPLDEVRRVPPAGSLVGADLDATDLNLPDLKPAIT